MKLPIPQWLLSLLIVLAKKVGIPLLVKIWPGLPKEVIEVIEAVLLFVSGSPDKPAAVAQVRAALTTRDQVCEGIECHLPVARKSKKTAKG